MKGGLNMDEHKALALSQNQATELKALVDAEMERKLEGIHVLLQARYTTSGGYKEPEVWGELKAKIVELVQSNLAPMGKRLASLLDSPAEAGK